MISDILAITDRLFGFLVQQKESQIELFEKLFEPIYNDLEIVHKNYLVIFTDVLSSLNDKRTPIIEIATKLKDQRIEFEPVRDRIRAFSQAYNMNSKDIPNKEFLPFINCIKEYLPTGNLYPYPSYSKLFLDKLNELAESELAEWFADDQPFPYGRKGLILILESTIVENRKNWSQLSKEYMNLKLLVYGGKKKI